MTNFRSSSPPGPLSQSSIAQLDLQLNQWFGMLPPHLRWQQDSPEGFPDSTTRVYSSISTFSGQPILSTGPAAHGISQGTGPMFGADLAAIPKMYPFVMDIQVALLRSRYYYTEHLIHRPFVYKALHFPDALTRDDCRGAADCLRAGLRWPVAMSPVAKHKRLVPCLLFWNQNLLGVLVLLHLSQSNPALREIRSTLCGERFDLDARDTVALYVDWLRDVRAVDASARWCWDIVRALYGLEDGP